MKLISSLPLDHRETIFYYPDIHVLSFDDNNEEYIKASEDFGKTLYRLFLGIRKLRILNQSDGFKRMLYIEPSRNCNLACTYCYAHAGPQFTKRLELNRIKNLVGRYNFSGVTFLGGEPLVDKAYLRSVVEMKDWDYFFFSTNGTLATESDLSYVKSRNINFQISLEPKEWSYRVNVGGKKQYDMLKPKLHIFAKYANNLSIRVVLKDGAPYVPLRDFIDGIAEDIGSYNFTIGYWPAEGDTKLSDIFDRWVEESYAIMKSDDARKYKHKLLGHMDNIFGSDIFRFYFCNAGRESVAVGPDGQLHECHRNAIKEANSDGVSSDDDPIAVDEAKLTALLFSWLDKMNNDICSSCAARYICGGLCYLDEINNAECSYITKLLPLALTEMNYYEHELVLKAMNKMQDTFRAFYSMRTQIERMVSNQEWDRLISGEMSVSEASILAQRYGI